MLLGGGLRSPSAFLVIIIIVIVVIIISWEISSFGILF